LTNLTKSVYLAKEIAYNYLKLHKGCTFSWIKFDNFDQVLNNFTLIFARRCLLIPKANEVIDKCFPKKRPQAARMIALMNSLMFLNLFIKVN
jgi:hypothetical protein